MAYYVSYYANNGFGPVSNTGTFHTKAQAQARAKEIKKISPKASPIVIEAGKKGSRNNPRSPVHARIPIGKKIKVNWVKQNRDGTVTVSVPVKRNPSKAKLRRRGESQYAQYQHLVDRELARQRKAQREGRKWHK